MPGRSQHRKTLTVLHDENRDRERHDKFNHGRNRPDRRLDHRADQFKLQRCRAVKPAEQDRRHGADQERPDDWRA